ncbi:MAG: hypothetical protein FWG87_08360 [Defluviitaleaceae bacterium]|nr:hypothetical protein [Defluviitaleaceae bacterium]
MTNEIKISPNFTIEDIHKIRYANYERTKNMTPKEIIEHTRKEAQYGLDFLKKLKDSRGI